ncbi:hypothetical protein HMPREF9004_0625 [Schaalia cardiffensis F0333]|uniref:Uncharacterized protein n=1 Tax=Schaalia cardiffensis F0333 TaxID=888050 RepID=N6X4D3_9ACTO|nr:hypothetical protein HMPREF9004_0625 [Schaalia cardiffensis F0333]
MKPGAKRGCLGVPPLAAPSGSVKAGAKRGRPELPFRAASSG